jgi:hypothetical protein
MIKFGVVFVMKIFKSTAVRINKYPVIFLTAMVTLGSCTKIEHLSPIPSISFTSFTIFDTTDILGNESKAGRLKFYFEDGDGDIGLKVPSGGTSDSTNLFFTLYRKTNGIMERANEDDPLYPSDYRIPYMVRLGQNKILRGTISVTFLYLFYSPTDTIKYDFYLKDRAPHESNMASTSEIVISVNNVYK